MLASFGEGLGLAREQAIALGRSLGGGMGMAQVCGAVSGAMLILGLLPKTDGPDEARRRQETLALAARLRQRFAQARGSVVCRDLLGVDISTPEGRRQAVEQELFGKLCPLMVADAAAILEEMLAETAQAPAAQPH